MTDESCSFETAQAHRVILLNLHPKFTQMRNYFIVQQRPENALAYSFAPHIRPDEEAHPRRAIVVLLNINDTDRLFAVDRHEKTSAG